jgi:hypothetical protein
VLSKVEIGVVVDLILVYKAVEVDKLALTVAEEVRKLREVLPARQTQVLRAL